MRGGNKFFHKSTFWKKLTDNSTQYHQVNIFDDLLLLRYHKEGREADMRAAESKPDENQPAVCFQPAGDGFFFGG